MVKNFQKTLIYTLTSKWIIYITLEPLCVKGVYTSAPEAVRFFSDCRLIWHTGLRLSLFYKAIFSDFGVQIVLTLHSQL